MIQLYQTLDLRPIGIPQTLRLSQYDSDFEIIFELTNFDGAWILDTSTTAEVQGTKTDGHGYSADAVFDDQLKTVTIAGDVQMTAAAGRNVYEVVLFHDGDRLGSKNFILDVERAALDAETTASDSKIKNFTEMVESAEQAAETATAAAEAAEEAAASIIPGLSDDAKEALLACFRHVAWIDDQGPTVYDALEDALYEQEKRLVSISAAFTQGTAVITSNDPLDYLRQFLTVTGLYNDGTTAEIEHYTLAGTLSAASSTIIAAYDGEQDEFTVTVTEVPAGYTRANYVQADGTQYIKSGLHETDVQNYSWRHKILITGEYDRSGHVLSSNNFYVPFLSYFPNGTPTHRINAARFGGSYTLVSSGQWVPNTEYVIEAYRNGGNAIFLNGDETYSYTKGSNIDSSKELVFFQYGGNLTSTLFPFRGKFYFMQVFDQNGNKVHEYVPCVNGSNVAGLYDLIAGAFLPPTVGTLIAG